METFLLVAWIYVGDGQFELMRTPGLKDLECHLRAMRVEHVRGQIALCINETKFEPAWSPRAHGARPDPVCASCGLLPGRKRI